MNQAFEAYSQLEKIELVSYETRQLTECRPENIVFPGKDGQARLTGCFSEKTGRTYDAAVILEDDGAQTNYRLEFERRS